VHPIREERLEHASDIGAQSHSLFWSYGFTFGSPGHPGFTGVTLFS
jgi:hypothetical protein